MPDLCRERMKFQRSLSVFEKTRRPDQFTASALSQYGRSETVPGTCTRWTTQMLQILLLSQAMLMVFPFLLEVRVETVVSRHSILLVNLEMVACNRYRDGNSVNVRKCGELGALAKVPGYSMRKWQRKGC